MGYFDEMKSMLGRGMNVADRKTQELRLQAELSRIGSSLESAYSALGRVVYSHPTLAGQIQRECPGEYNAITSLLKEGQDVRGRIEELQRQAVMTTAPMYGQTGQLSCPRCGAIVTLDIAYCPTCGDNLSDLKSRYRICPNCSTYYSSDSIFCVQCGSKTIEIPVAPTVQQYTEDKEVASDGLQAEEPLTQGESQVRAESSLDDGIQDAETHAVEDVPVSTSPTCPHCGAAISVDDAFCGECGSRLNG